MFTRMNKIPQAVLNELLWLKETTPEERVKLLSGERLSQSRINTLAGLAASRQRENAAGRAMARALIALVKG